MNDMAKKEKQSDINEEQTENTVNNTEEQTEQQTATEQPAELTAEEKLQQDLDSTKESLLRLAAEFDNFKKRNDREREQLSAYVKADTVKKLLPVVDNITRSAACDSSSPDYTKGLEMIVKQLRETLDKMGLCEIEAKGAQFDPTLHEAVMHIEDDAFGENEVAEVLQAGYKLGETVLRPAMVKVAN
jgi:molecular chaperone GrpE